MPVYLPVLDLKKTSLSPVAVIRIQTKVKPIVECQIFSSNRVSTFILWPCSIREYSSVNSLRLQIQSFDSVHSCVINLYIMRMYKFYLNFLLFNHRSNKGMFQVDSRILPFFKCLIFSNALSQTSPPEISAHSLRKQPSLSPRNQPSLSQKPVLSLSQKTVLSTRKQPSLSPRNRCSLKETLIKAHSV